MGTLVEVGHGSTVVISRGDARSVSDLLDAGRSEATRRSYASALRTFALWCDERGYPAVPTTPDVVAAYVADRTRSVSHATISRDVAAISAGHRDAGHDDPTAHHGVRSALRAAGRLLGTSPARRAAPLTTASVRRVIEAMSDLDTIVGKRDRAILLIGLAAALRRSEIAALRTDHLVRLDGGLLLRIPRSKTDQSGKGELIGIPKGTNPMTCPVLTLDSWLMTSDRSLGDGAPVFSRIFNHSTISSEPLSDRSVARIVQARAMAAGITGSEYAQRFGTGEAWISGHSLRAGHATSAAEAGIDPLRIARTTRHRRLDSLARYVRPVSAVGDSTAGQIGL